MRRMPQSTRALTLLRSAGPTLLVCAGAAAAVARVAADPTGRVVGHPLSEAPSHLWMQWLLDRAVWEGAALFGQRDVVLGEQLWVMPADWSTRLLVGPLGWVIGRPAAYNVAVLGLLILAGLATRALAARAGASRWPAALAGLLVIWHPAVLGYAADGRLDSLGIGWSALVGWAWLGLVTTPSWAAGLRLGACAAATVLAGINLTAATSIAALAPTLFVAWSRPRVRGPLLAAAGLAAAATASVLGILLSVERHDPGRLLQDSNLTSRPLVSIASSASQLAEQWVGARALHETAVSSIWSLSPAIATRSSLQQAASELILWLYAPGGWWYLAAVPWALVGLGLLRAPRRIAPWALGAALLQLLAMGYGPSQTLPLSLGGETRYYLAPAVLLEQLPGLSAFNNYGLFGGLAAIALATGAALSLSLSGLRWAGLLSVLLAAAWGAEIALRSPAPLPLPATEVRPPSAWLDALATLPPGEGVLVLPLSQELTYLLQTHHGRPVTVRFRPLPDATGEPQQIADPSGKIQRFLQGVARGSSNPSCDLDGAGLGAVVLLPALLPPAQRAVTRQRVEGCLGAPRWSIDGAHIYATSASGPSDLP
ncbi:MAG: hypothetical protein ACI8S6_004042, partial [Myxococcota bacterium]